VKQGIMKVLQHSKNGTRGFVRQCSCVECFVRQCRYLVIFETVQKSRVICETVKA
jgi:hypothetical protein